MTPNRLDGVLHKHDRRDWNYAGSGQVPNSLPRNTVGSHFPRLAPIYRNKEIHSYDRQREFLRVSALTTAVDFRDHVTQTIDPFFPVDEIVLSAKEGSPLARPGKFGKILLGNRFAIQQPDGHNCDLDGSPTLTTRRNWAFNGLSGGKLILGEPAAVSMLGRSSPRQMVLNSENADKIRDLVEICKFAHAWKYGESALSDFAIGISLAHAGRYSVDLKGLPTSFGMFKHPMKEANLSGEIPIVSDQYLEELVLHYVNAAKLAKEAGFNFVDIQACHGYLLHESLAARQRPNSKFGGSDFKQRSNLLLTIIQEVKNACPDLEIGVRLSIFDTAANEIVNPISGLFRPSASFPYMNVFGACIHNPNLADLSEPISLCKMLHQMGVAAVSITAGDHKLTPQLANPAPLDNLGAPANFDPLRTVFHILEAGRQVKEAIPELSIICGEISPTEEYFGNVAQAVVSEGWSDIVGVGRRSLPDPLLPQRLLDFGDQFDWHNDVKASVCRSFLHCQAAIKLGASLGAGCYPIVQYYGDKETQAAIADWMQQHRL